VTNGDYLLPQEFHIARAQNAQGKHHSAQIRIHQGLIADFFSAGGLNPN
jgi:hypothetical protein